MTDRTAVAALLLANRTPHEAASVVGVSVSYARTIRRDLVAEGKLPKVPGRGRPRKELIA